MRPAIFIASSRESLPVARAIQTNLDHDADVTVWTDDVFRLSETSCASLDRIVNNVDYGVFVLSDDDTIQIGESKILVPRDNVVLELGMFIGKLGLEHCFLVRPRDFPLRLPSDVQGITAATYHLHSSGELVPSLASVCNQLRSQIQGGSAKRSEISWEEVCKAVRTLATKFRPSTERGGFFFHAIIGITRGGIIVTDLLSRHLGGDLPVLALWAKRGTRDQQPSFGPPDNKVNRHLIAACKTCEITNILLVEDISRSGTTLRRAQKFIQSILPDKTVKTAVLFIDKGSEANVDYWAEKRYVKDSRMPFSKVE